MAEALGWPPKPLTLGAWGNAVDTNDGIYARLCNAHWASKSESWS